MATMTDTLRHRGPDDEGYLAVYTREDPIRTVALAGPDTVVDNQMPLLGFDDTVHLYLGHRRLSIVDLSPAGHQPMHHSEHLWITFNGEIYNYPELREELTKEGYCFKSESDTEVILAAYNQWGEECVRRFNGDWAFCILDTKRNSIFLSRDRFGVKPLYFFQSNEYFAFASEIKALLSLPFARRSLDPENAFDYCVLSCNGHTEGTLFQDIRQVMPGQSIEVNIKTAATRKWQHYSLSLSPELGKYDHRKALAYASDIYDLLFDAVRIRLRADVKVGTCLSGGLDSSTIVAIASRILKVSEQPYPIDTFTAGFPGHNLDETRFAQLVSTVIGTNSHVIHPSSQDYWAILPTILHHQDEPFGETSLYAQWTVMREASRFVKVVLDGQGGDELFGGYDTYRSSFLVHLFSKREIQKIIWELWYTCIRAGGLKRVLEQIKPLVFYSLPNLLKRRSYGMHTRHAARSASKAFGVSIRHGIEHVDRMFSSNLNDILYHHIKTYSLPQLLRAEDRNSMAHSIEARVPFTDYRLVDYVSALPAAYKIHHGWTKWLLRLAVRDLLPPTIVWRADKLGFATPAWATRKEEWEVWSSINFDCRKKGFGTIYRKASKRKREDKAVTES